MDSSYKQISNYNYFEEQSFPDCKNLFFVDYYLIYRLLSQKIEVAVIDLVKKHPASPPTNNCIVLDRESLDILRTKIMVIMIDEIKPKKYNEREVT